MPDSKTINQIIANATAVKTALQELANAPSGGNNTLELQMTFDLMTNMPLLANMSINEFYLYYNSGMWAQVVTGESNFKIAPILYNDLIDGISVYKHKGFTYDKNDGIKVQAYIHDLHGKACTDYLMKTNSDGNILTPPTSSLKTIKIGTGYSPTESRHEALNRYLSKYSNTTNIVNSTYNKFDNPIAFDPIMDPREYSVLQLPTAKFNYYINKHPLIVRTSPSAPPTATSSQILPRKESQYDILIYPNRIVYLSSGNLETICTYKVFKLPSLELLESGSDIKSGVYKKLKLTRAEIIGPNVYTETLPVTATVPYKACKVVHGFRIINGDLYDIYMNSVRLATNKPLKYESKMINGETVLIHY